MHICFLHLHRSCMLFVLSAPTLIFHVISAQVQPLHWSRMLFLRSAPTLIKYVVSASIDAVSAFSAYTDHACCFCFSSAPTWIMDVVSHFQRLPWSRMLFLLSTWISHACCFCSAPTLIMHVVCLLHLPIWSRLTSLLSFPGLRCRMQSKHGV